VKQLENVKQFIIDVNIQLPPEMVEYIVDCWTNFVYQDLNYDIKDLPITIV
jgi:hypothetical protein